MHRIVFISLEFSAGTFSGNGVYARSQASDIVIDGLRHNVDPNCAVTSTVFCMYTGTKLVPAELRLAGVKRQARWFQCSTTD